MTLKVLACQISIPPMISAIARDEHVQRTAQLIDQQLTQTPADLVVLPELSSIDYSRAAFEHLDLIAEAEQGHSYSIWRQLAIKHSCSVVYGFASRDAEGYWISTAVVQPDGELAGVYNKLHLAQFGDSMEKEYFIAGDQRLLLFDINGYKLAPIICYDIRAPELCRTLAIDHDVDIILHTGAYARDASFYSWHAFATTRAIENQVYFLSLNRAGEHFGHSVFCQPWVDENSPPLVFDHHAEQLVMLTIERDQIITAREQYTFLQDRLPDYNLPVIDPSKH